MHLNYFWKLIMSEWLSTSSLRCLGLAQHHIFTTALKIHREGASKPMHLYFLVLDPLILHMLYLDTCNAIQLYSKRISKHHLRPVVTDNQVEVTPHCSATYKQVHYKRKQCNHCSFMYFLLLTPGWTQESVADISTGRCCATCTLKRTEWWSCSTNTMWSWQCDS